MSQQDPAPQQRIADRYAARPSRWPRVILALGVVLFVGLAGWLAWAVWVHSTPQIRSSLTRWTVEDPHAVAATLDVRMKDDTHGPRCLLRAYAEDHTIVGEASFVPQDGRNEVRIRTEREATSVESVGCSATGQNDAR